MFDEDGGNDVMNAGEIFEDSGFSTGNRFVVDTTEDFGDAEDDYDYSDDVDDDAGGGDDEVGENAGVERYPPDPSTSAYFDDVRQQKVGQPSILSSAAPVLIFGKDRKSLPLMTRFEYARLIGERATDLEAGVGAALSTESLARAEELLSRGDESVMTSEAVRIGTEMGVDPLVIHRAKLENIDEALDIAELELEMTHVDFPMIISRTISTNVYEVWKVRELETPTQVLCKGYSLAATAATAVQSTEHCPINPSDASSMPYWMAVRKTDMIKNSI